MAEPIRTHAPRFLLLRGGAIGDFIATLPVLQALRAQWPEAVIEIWGYPHVAELAVAAGLAQSVVSLERAEMARFFVPEPQFTLPSGGFASQGGEAADSMEAAAAAADELDAQDGMDAPGEDVIPGRERGEQQMPDEASDTGPRSGAPSAPEAAPSK